MALQLGILELLLKNYKVPIPVCAGASKGDTHGQLGIIAGQLVGELTKNDIFHTLSWLSHKGTGLVRSVLAAEGLAGSKAIDEAKIILYT